MPASAFATEMKKKKINVITLILCHHFKRDKEIKPQFDGNKVTEHLNRLHKETRPELCQGIDP